MTTATKCGTYGCEREGFDERSPELGDGDSDLICAHCLVAVDDDFPGVIFDEYAVSAARREIEIENISDGHGEHEMPREGCRYCGGRGR